MELIGFYPGFYKVPVLDFDLHPREMIFFPLKKRKSQKTFLQLMSKRFIRKN